MHIETVSDTILTTAGTLTRAQLEKMNSKTKEDKLREGLPKVDQEHKPPKRCPFINGISKGCLNKCAFYNEEKKCCRIQERKAEIRTEGRVCPLSFNRGRENCTSYCAFNVAGNCAYLS